MAFTVNLPEVYVSIEQAWNDAIQRAQFEAKANAAIGQLSRQTARVEPIITGSNEDAKIITKRIYWQNFCNIVAEDCTTQCDPSAIEITDNSQTHTISLCKQASFFTSWKTHRNVPHNLAGTIAGGLLKATKELDEWISNQFVLYVDTQKGDHEYQNPDWTIAADVASVPNANWTEAIIPEFELAAEFAYLGPYYMLEGLNTWATRRIAGAKQVDDNGAGTASLWNSKNWVDSPIELQKSATTDNRTYLIANSALAILTGNYFSERPVEFGGKYRMWTIPSRNLPGVRYDVTEVENCSSNDFTISYKVQANYQFALNPTGCVAGRTGVLAFEKAAEI